MLLGTQGSHEWLCKPPKREGTFPLAESAVKRFPVTVIAAFEGIISVEDVGGGGEGAGRQGKTPGQVWSPCTELRNGQREGVRCQAQSHCWGPRVAFGQTFWTSPFPPKGQSPILRSPCGRLHTHSLPPVLRFPWVTLFPRLQSQLQLPRLLGLGGGEAPDYLAQFLLELATHQNHRKTQVLTPRAAEAPGEGPGNLYFNRCSSSCRTPGGPRTCVEASLPTSAAGLADFPRCTSGSSFMDAADIPTPPDPRTELLLFSLLRMLSSL